MSETEYYAKLSAERMAEIIKLRAELSKSQESEFHPDWSLLKAARDSRDEARAENAELKAEITLLAGDVHKTFVNDDHFITAVAKHTNIKLIDENEKLQAEAKRLKEENIIWFKMNENNCNKDLQKDLAEAKQELAEIKERVEKRLETELQKLMPCDSAPISTTRIEDLMREREQLRAAAWEVVGEYGLNGSIETLEDVMKKFKE